MSRQLCEDNDPLDVLVLMQEPVYPMSFLRCGFCITVLLSIPAVDLVVFIAHLCVAGSASAADATTCLIVEYSMRIGAFFIGFGV